MSQYPIADYALLSNCHGAALLHRHGSLDWLCLPRFDSPALCSRLLDADGGHWRIGPAQPAQVTRRYVEGTMVVETTFRTADGCLVLRDGLAVGANDTGHELGLDSPHAMLREAHCSEGSVELEMEYAPRPEYGLIHPILQPVEEGLLTRGGASVLRLSTPVPLQVHDSAAHARVRLQPGDRVGFALEHRYSSEPRPGHWSARDVRARLDDTVRAWKSWSELHQSYDGPWRDQVLHSGRILQALTYFPTGAIVAAATTSLPEIQGGGRNWDYRYTWIRDASLTLDALWVAACPDEAYKFFDFVTHAAFTQLQRGRDIQIVFGIGGEHDLSERTIDHLAGWRNSAPVRVGNAAWRQRQLDAYGQLLAAADRLKEQLSTQFDQVNGRFLARAADEAAARWEQPDQGIWEVRGEPRPFLYSKLMCWVALDRAINLAGFLGHNHRVEQWRATRQRIRRAILKHGWSDRAGAFTQAFGSDDLDASSLVLPIVGFLPADDPRMLATIDAVQERLTDHNGLVYRYRTADGLEGEEGAFLLCTFWLAQALAMAGEVSRARAVFDRAAAYANDLGLLAEEVDSGNGQLLGNFPQAFSHIGLVNAAWAIHEAEGRAADQA